MDCAAVGDSIAVGIAAVTGCAQHAKIGIGSDAILHQISKVRGDLVVISMGSNDPMNPNLLRNLRMLRAKVNADRVVWVMPYHRYAAQAVQRVAHERGDGVVDLAGFKSGDQVHPKNYVALAEKVMR